VEECVQVTINGRSVEGDLSARGMVVGGAGAIERGRDP
jgi:hypothetical protein